VPPTAEDGWGIPPAGTERHGPSLATAILSALLIGGGVVGLLNAADIVSVSIPVFLAGALVFTGLALLVSAWTGGTSGLIAVAVLLTAALAVASVVHAPVSGEWGDRRWVPSSLDEVRSRYRIGAGQATLDLSHLVLAGSRTVRATVGAGQIRVIVPDQGRIVADGHAGMGEVRLFGHHQGGWDVTDRVSTGDPAYGTLRLHLDVGAGQVEVIRTLAPPRLAPEGPTPPAPTPPAPPAPPVGSALGALRAAA
jgi:hypothetical protein